MITIGNGKEIVRPQVPGWDYAAQHPISSMNKPKFSGLMIMMKKWLFCFIWSTI